jgi:16S rRNA (adenine1518-N6/adenine1519-N6)-dimethyltransferase
VPRPLGQHFLVRDSVLERLTVAACGEYTARVIEIGPGRGALTRHLLCRAGELHAIEVDPELVAYVQGRLGHEPKLHLHKANVLTTDLGQWGPAAIIGNLPYYITSPIIKKFLDLDAGFEIAVFLIQREVGERLLAVPGTRDYGYLTVASQLICEVELICQLSPGDFRPPPKVHSTAVRFKRRAQLPANAAELLSFVSRCFAQKRKTLRNNLRPFYGPRIDGLPEAGLRAEQLSIDQLADLHGRLAAMIGSS